MSARDPQESHRAASPLELLTDLCFVVAIAQAAAELHHAISANHLAHGLLAFSMQFFAIWLAWMNFTWFASAYDNDDVPYRLLTILQIVGVLVVAAGIHGMSEGNFTLGVAGYLIMRVALVGQWLRAAAHDPPRRVTCLRFAYGIIFVQVLWVLFLLMPPALRPWAFFTFAFLELLVPVFAEKAGHTTWHPHHIAERYGLFYIIVLGETILSATLAVQGMLNEHRTNYEVLCVMAGGVLIVFSAWWLYFSRNAGQALERVSRNVDHREAFFWGFGHYILFGAGAALGAGLASRVDYWTGKQPVPDLASSTMVTGPVAVLLTLMWILQVRPHDPSSRTWGPFAGAVAVVLAATFLPMPEVTTGVICSILLFVELKLEQACPPLEP
jgi:low temperature requirement protein LtrA